MCKGLAQGEDDPCRFHYCKLLPCRFQPFCIKPAGSGKHKWARQGRNSMANWMLWISKIKKPLEDTTSGHWDRRSKNSSGVERRAV